MGLKHMDNMTYTLIIKNISTPLPPLLCSPPPSIHRSKLGYSANRSTDMAINQVLHTNLSPPGIGRGNDLRLIGYSLTFN